MKRTGTIEKKIPSAKQTPVSPRLLTLKVAADTLGMSIWGLRERVWAGQIPVVRFPGGRKMWIDTRDIEKFIERNKMTYD